MDLLAIFEQGWTVPTITFILGAAVAAFATSFILPDKTPTPASELKSPLMRKIVDVIDEGGEFSHAAPEEVGPRIMYHIIVNTALARAFRHQQGDPTGTVQEFINRVCAEKSKLADELDRVMRRRENAA